MLLRFRLAGLARLVALSCILLAIVLPASADIDTHSSWNGSENTGPFGVTTGTPTYGQTITVPSGVSPLSSFSFEVRSCTRSIIARGEVYAWAGGTTTGSALFQSSPVTISTGAMHAVSFTTGSLSLPAGRYVLLMTTLRDGGQAAARCNVGAMLSGPYPDGDFVATEDSPSSWGSQPWMALPLDLAFRVNGLNPIAATPAFSLAGGDYPGPQTVAITSSTDGATIRYTTDGTTPSETAGTLYTGPVTVSASATLKAIAYITGYANSGVAEATYNILVAAPPAFSPAGGSYQTAQTVSITSTTPGASIRYTTDGSTPSETVGTLYSGPVTVSATATLKAIAYATGYGNSGVAQATYSILAAAPAVFSPAGGSYPGPQTVTLTSSTPGASIRFVVEGGYFGSGPKTPTCSDSFTYKSPLTIAFPATVKAIVCAEGLAASSVSVATYTILAAAPPVFSPAAGTYAGPQTITISSESVDHGAARIRYTTDGTTPTPEAGTDYYDPITLNASGTIKAIVYGDGIASSEASAEYTILITEPPTFSVAPGTYAGTQTVAIASSTPGAVIRYTVEGTTPSATIGNVYTEPVTVSATTTLKAAAVAPGYGVSSVASALYTITPPQITSVSPTSGAAGTQVVVSGSGFGAANPGSSLWLGTRASTVVSWSDTQIVATVAPGAMSGTVQVNRLKSKSNTVEFTVPTPVVTGITPSTAAPGAQVTITGSGFGSAQGSGQLWLGSANGVVQSWSDTQIVALVAAGATGSGARVLQNGVATSAVEFQVNRLRLTSVTPDSAAIGASVTLTGTAFGAVQGSGSVWLGSAAGVVVSWSDTEIVATVASGSVSGIARVTQNSEQSNTRHFTIPVAGGNTVAPSVLTMTVGETHEIQALSEAGQAVTGLTWTTSDANVVSLSIADPPVLTAVAAGHATIKAGSAAADVTVTAGELAPGTVIWSNPGPAGGVSRIVPAVPSTSGVADVFAFSEDGSTVSAITSEGKTAWTASLQNEWTATPDFQGGLVWLDTEWDPASFYGTATVVKIDGLTGERRNLYTDNSWYGYALLRIHPDGTALYFHYGEESTVTGIDTVTGATKFTIPLPSLQWYYDFIVAGDGNAYIAWHYRTYDSPDDATFHIVVTRISSDGVYTTLPIREWAYGGSPDMVEFPVSLITDADNGVALTWYDFSGSSGIVDRRAIINGSEVTLLEGVALPELQREDRTFIGRVWFATDVWHMVAFDRAGAVLWSVPNEEPYMALEGGGVLAKSGMVYDQNGAAVGMMETRTQSWRGNAYRVGSIESVLQPLLNFAPSFWAFAFGNPSGTSVSARPWQFRLSWLNDCTNPDPETKPCGFFVYPDNPQVRRNLLADATPQAMTVKSAALSAFKKAFEKYPVTVAEGRRNTGDHRVNVIDGYSLANPCGRTDNAPSVTLSEVFYQSAMQQAQWARGIVLTSSQEVQAALGSSSFMNAIGAGIGNNAAHELAHQFLGSHYGMDDNSTGTYNSKQCDGDRAPWVFGVSPIQWGAGTAAALKVKLGGGAKK